MLSDEERQAIKGLEWSQQQMRLGNLPDYDQGHYADIRIILDLIEKQQKEIEELNKSDASKEQSSMNYYNMYKELVDKIKAKIEEIDFMIKEINQGHLQKYTVGELLGAKRFLESLLEKE